MNVLLSSCCINFKLPKVKYKYWASFYIQGSLKHHATIQTNSYQAISDIAKGYEMNHDLQQYPSTPCQIVLSKFTKLLVFTVRDTQYTKTPITHYIARCYIPRRVQLALCKATYDSRISMTLYIDKTSIQFRREAEYPVREWDSLLKVRTWVKFHSFWHNNKWKDAFDIIDTYVIR